MREPPQSQIFDVRKQLAPFLASMRAYLNIKYFSGQHSYTRADILFTMMS